jgi:GNAT superfamily N-acetyltransferase
VFPLPPKAADSRIALSPVKSDRDLDAFIDLPWRIYAGYPLWVPPLKSDIRDILSEKNPFWKHADKRLFLAYRDGAPVGRCAAVVDRTYVEFHEEPCGFFGFFESIDDADVAGALLSVARDWLGKRGMRLMRGPASPSLNEECGVLIEGFDDPPAIMMPYTPPYYPALLERAGLRKSKDLLSYHISTASPIPARIENLAKRIGRKGNITVRCMRKNKWDEELNIVRDIYNEAWEKNWGFTPMTGEELDAMAEKLKPILHADAVHFVEVTGRAVAFSIMLPDINQALKHLDGKLGIWGTLKFLYYFRKIDRLRLITLGVRKDYRNRGFEVLLYRESWLTSRRKGWKDAELGWILENNEPMNRGMRALEGRVYKKYRIYEGDVASFAS